MIGVDVVTPRENKPKFARLLDHELMEVELAVAAVMRHEDVAGIVAELGDSPAADEMRAFVPLWREGWPAIRWPPAQPTDGAVAGVHDLTAEFPELGEVAAAESFALFKGFQINLGDSAATSVKERRQTR